MADNSREEEQIREDEAVIAGLTPAQQAAMLRHASRLTYTTPLPDDVTEGEMRLWHEGIADAAFHLAENGDAPGREAYGPPLVRAEPEPPAQLPPWTRLRANQTLAPREDDQ